MRKLLAIILAAVLFAAVSFAAGRQVGIRHAITDACIWTVECYDPDDPYANVREDGLDQTIFIELDGDIYEHGMYQG